MFYEELIEIIISDYKYYVTEKINISAKTSHQ